MQFFRTSYEKIKAVAFKGNYPVRSNIDSKTREQISYSSSLGYRVSYESDRDKDDKFIHVGFSC